MGSRSASAVALETVQQLGIDLAALGITVVSCLAHGVDSLAHFGASCLGRTVAVLVSIVDRIYSREHATLAGEIKRTGWCGGSTAAVSCVRDERVSVNSWSLSFVF